MNDSGYLQATAAFYRDVAIAPEVGLCCVAGGSLTLPGLVIPERMAAMNYGCGTTVQPRELVGEPTVVYVGVGGGLEALQFAYFSRRAKSVIAIEPVPEMRSAALANLAEAAQVNDWFDPSFVEIRAGDALALPIDDQSADVVAQNCLFNIFEPEDLAQALREARRILKPGGRLLMSDPIATRPIPAALRQDDRLRAMCLSGAQTYEAYVQHLTDAGFGQVEIRARRPYRLLDHATYGLDTDLLLESLDTVSFNQPIPADGPCIFTGKTAIYRGQPGETPNATNDQLNPRNNRQATSPGQPEPRPEPFFDDGLGHILTLGLPLGVCDKTAAKLATTLGDRVCITPSTWHYQGDGCC